MENVFGKMTCRKNPKTGRRVSLLGYGCMRWPEKALDNDGKPFSRTGQELDQEKINALVDRAIEGGVTYFDTSPTYCGGQSETAVGIALSRHPREKYTIATKLSNFDPATQTREASEAMYWNSYKALQTDHIDYYLFHAIGNTGWEGFEDRFLKNGMFDFLLGEREAGRIGNLGFSYHGDPRTFEYMMSRHDEVHWDFAQIEMNYVDWRHAHDLNSDNLDAEYLYGELQSRGIPVVVMEPLLGGRLGKVPNDIAARCLSRDPQRSVASWAFRFVGSHPGVLTALSGMTFMENLEDNLRTFSPLEPLSESDYDFLEENARLIMRYPTVPCSACSYCMPCPTGLDIPGLFAQFNKGVIEGDVHPVLDAAACVACGTCMPKCPQCIKIPEEMARISGYSAASK